MLLFYILYNMTSTTKLYTSVFKDVLPHQFRYHIDLLYGECN